SAAGSRESEQCRQLAPSCARHGRKTSSSSALSADTWDGPCAFPPRPQWSSASWWKQLLQPFHSGEKQPECPRSQLLSCLSSLRSLLNCRPSLHSPCRASRPLPWSCLSTSLCSRPSTSAWCSASTSSWLPSSSNPWTQPTSSPSFSSSAWSRFGFGCVHPRMRVGRNPQFVLTLHCLDARNVFLQLAQLLQAFVLAHLHLEAKAENLLRRLVRLLHQFFFVQIDDLIHFHNSILHLQDVIGSRRLRSSL